MFKRLVLRSKVAPAYIGSWKVRKTKIDIFGERGLVPWLSGPAASVKTEGKISCVTVEIVC